MKTESTNKIKLGLFVSIGIALLATGIYYIGETKKLFSSTFRVSAMFKDVNGLQVGNNVRFAGINVGTVDGIEIISDSTVKVDMIVDVKTQKFIKKDSKAIIGSDGLMGNKVMNISAGTAGVAMIKDNEVIATTLPISMDAMLLKLKDAVDNAAIITGDLAVVIGNVKSGKGTIGKLFMDEGFANSLDGTITNVKQGTKGFQQNMDGLKTSIDVAKNNFFLKGLFSKPLTEAEEKKLKADNKLKEDIKQKEQQKIKDEKEKAEQKIKDDKLKLKEEKQKVKDEENRIKEDKKDFDKEEKQKIKDEKKKLKEDKKNLRDSE